MAGPGLSELTLRAREIFRLVVEGYIANGQPVGSRTIAGSGAVGLSPAEPSLAERTQIERGLAEGGTIEAALAAASSTLSDLSAAAGVVMVPRREMRLAQISFVPLGQARALVVLVGDDGSVENRVIDLPSAASASALEQAGNYLTARMAGRTLADALRAIRAEIASGRSALDTASAALVERGLAVWSRDAAQRPVLVVRGQANLLDEAALGDIERVRQLLDELESAEAIANVLDAAREADSARIFIGSENRLFSLSGSSVIAAPWRDGEGRVVGVVGVIGPTRLNYARVVPMVDFTAQSLSRIITQDGFGRK